MEIYLSDLKPEVQEAVVNYMGDNMNWDVFPLFTLEKEDDDEQNAD